jgi:hypothetical protein
MSKPSFPASTGMNATLTIRRRTSRAGYTVRQYPARVVSRSRGAVIVDYVTDADTIARRACYPSQVRVHP